jgi:hypothetical protein
MRYHQKEDFLVNLLTRMAENMRKSEVDKKCSPQEVRER